MSSSVSVNSSLSCYDFKSTSTISYTATHSTLIDLLLRQNIYSLHPFHCPNERCFLFCLLPRSHAPHQIFSLTNPNTNSHFTMYCKITNKNPATRLTTFTIHFSLLLWQPREDTGLTWLVSVMSTWTTCVQHSRRHVSHGWVHACPHQEC